MQTDFLIRELVEGVTPVEVLPSPTTRFLRWLPASLFLVTFGAVLLGIRVDLSQKLSNVPFVLQGVLLLAVGIVASKAAFDLSVPGYGNARRLPLLLPWLGLLGWLVILAWQWTHANAEGETHWRYLIPGLGLCCVKGIAMLSLLPSATLFYMVRRAAPLTLGINGVFIMLASVALSAFGLQLSCHEDVPVHLFVSHFVPLTLLAILGSMLGAGFLRR